MFDEWEAGDIKVSEKKKISMVNGTNFFKVESTIYSSGSEDIIVAIGITTFGHSSLIKNKARGLLSSWEKPDSTHGYLGTAAVADPVKITGYVKSGGDELVLVKVKPNQPFTYYAGAGWEGNKRFKKPGSWEKEMKSMAGWTTLNKIYRNSKKFITSR